MDHSWRILAPFGVSTKAGDDHLIFSDRPPLDTITQAVEFLAMTNTNSPAEERCQQRRRIAAQIIPFEDEWHMLEDTIPSQASFLRRVEKAAGKANEEDVSRALWFLAGTVRVRLRELSRAASPSPAAQ
jgi:hypothetical protein